MKKLFLGATLGVIAGAVGYKMYKENEEKINELLSNNFEDDLEEIAMEDIDVEDLEDLRNCIDEMIDAKLDYEHDKHYDEEFYDHELDNLESDDYIVLGEADCSIDEDNNVENLSSCELDEK